MAVGGDDQSECVDCIPVQGNVVMFKNWLRKKKTAQVDLTLNEVYLALHAAQHHHSFLEVAIDGSDVVYQSMILSLDPQERTILIDELFPRDFVGLPGQCVHCSIRQPQGRKLQFESVIVEGYRHAERPLYVMAMPAAVEESQRRGSYRLPVGGELEVKSSFVGPDDRSYRARLRNLSAGGACIEVDSAAATSWRSGNTLKALVFEFAGISVGCDLAVRNISENNRGVALIGGEFSELPVETLRALERSIMRVQRGRARVLGDWS